MARSENRYAVTSKTTKAEAVALLATCNQHLLNTQELVHQHEVSMEAMAASLRAKDMLLAEHVATIAVLKAEVERHASLLRKNVAQRNHAFLSPSSTDIAACCKALNVRSVSREQLMDWLRANPHR